MRTYLLVIATILLTTTPVFAEIPGTAHYEYALRYVTCSGEHAEAEWFGNKFFQMPVDGAAFKPHNSNEIDYRSWSGACVRSTWDASTSKWHMAGDATADRDSVTIEYITADGSFNSALRDGYGFTTITIDPTKRPDGARRKQAANFLLRLHPELFQASEAVARSM